MPTSPPSVGSRLRKLRWVVGDVAVVAGAAVLDVLIWGFDGQSRFVFMVPVPVVLTTTVGAFAVLLVRRNHPWIAFLSAWAYSVFWALLLLTYQPFTGLLISVYQFARHTNVRWGRHPLWLLLVPWMLDTYNAVVAIGTHASAVAVTAALWFALAAAVWLIGRGGWRTQRIYELEAANQTADHDLALQQQQMRFARELHDIVAHSISAVMFQAAGARAIAANRDPQLDEILKSIETASTRAMRELRRLLGLLHPEDDHDLVNAVASLDDLDDLIKTTRACSVNVRLSEEGQRIPLDPSVDHIAYRVLQESLTNTMKHGGPGAEVDLHLLWQRNQLRITARSHTGRGASRPNPEGPGGYGLRGLNQRVAGVGGHVEAGPLTDGYLVVARLPLDG